MHRSLLLLLLLFIVQPFLLTAQPISIQAKELPLPALLRQLEQQSGCHFVFTSDLIERSLPVTVSCQGLQLDSLLELIFSAQPLCYSRVMDWFVIKDCSGEGALLTGVVQNAAGQPVAGVSLLPPKGMNGAITNADGRFQLSAASLGKQIRISCIGYQTYYWLARKPALNLIVLTEAVQQLEEFVVDAYSWPGRTDQAVFHSRVITGNQQLPLTVNPLEGVQGKITGVQTKTASGWPGTVFQLLIRGRHSLQQGNAPLFIIDGIPLTWGNHSVSQLTTLLGADPDQGFSPFSLISPADIERIEILKDAAATAMYGSRGANGVVVIHTYRNKGRGERLSATVSAGMASIARPARFLNTEQYLLMRKEAFRLDGLQPTAVRGAASYAPDLLFWDSNRDTELSKFFLKNPGRQLQSHLRWQDSIAGMRFHLNGNYQQFTGILPRGANFRRVSNQGAISIPLGRFRINASWLISSLQQQLFTGSLQAALQTPPNLPILFNEEGNLNEYDNGIRFWNPLRILGSNYSARLHWTGANLEFQYRFSKTWHWHLTFGSIQLGVRERAVNSIDSSIVTFQQQAHSRNWNWAAETQLRFQYQLPGFNIHALAGLAAHQQLTRFQVSAASLEPASSTHLTRNIQDYRYAAFFARLTIDWGTRWQTDLTARYDGSSRFSPEDRFAGFGAMALHWQFYKHRAAAPQKRGIDFAALRISIGLTGNDQVGDHQYFDQWLSTSNGSIRPVSPARSAYGWETSYKYEAAVMTSAWNKRINGTVIYYFEQSRNQLAEQKLPAQTGFPALTGSLPVRIRNTGLEAAASAVLLNKRHWYWLLAGNISIPRNRLHAAGSVPLTGLGTRFREGQSLNLIYGYQYEGVDPQTGRYRFSDQNADGILQPYTDFIESGNTDPAFLGGIQSELRFKKISLRFGFDFGKAKQPAVLKDLYQSSRIPGMPYNQPVRAFDWGTAGLARFSTSAGTDTRQLLQSNAIYENISCFRLRSLELAWSTGFFQGTRRWHCRVFVNGQLLFTISRYRDADPELPGVYALGPLKQFAAGIQLSK